jgi:hypothetical protein
MAPRKPESRLRLLIEFSAVLVVVVLVVLGVLMLLGPTGS